MYMQYNHETRKLNTSNMNSQAVPQIRFNTGRRGTIACKPISSEKNNNFLKKLLLLYAFREKSRHTTRHCLLQFYTSRCHTTQE